MQTDSATFTKIFEQGINNLGVVPDQNFVETKMLEAKDTEDIYLLKENTLLHYELKGSSYKYVKNKKIRNATNCISKWMLVNSKKLLYIDPSNWTSIHMYDIESGKDEIIYSSK